MIFEFLYPKSIRSKLVMLVLISIIPSIFIVLYSDSKHREEALDNAVNRSKDVVNQFAAKQKNVVDKASQLLSTLSIMPEIISKDYINAGGMFKKVLKHTPEFNIIQLITKEGKLASSAAPFPDNIFMTDRKYFRDALESKKFSAGEYIVGKTTKMKMINFSKPILDSLNNIDAVIHVGLELSVFDSIFSDVHFAPKTNVVVTDHAGIILYNSNKSMNSVGNSDSYNMFKKIVSRKDEGTFFDKGDDGIERLNFFKKIRLENKSMPYLYIRAGFPTDIIYSKSRTIFIKDFIFLLLSSLITVIIALIIGEYSIAGKFRKLSHTASEIAMGFFKSKSGIVHDDSDIGRLAKSFDDMGNSLNQYNEKMLKSEMDLKFSENKFKMLFNNLNSAVYLWKVNQDGTIGNCIEVNESACNMLGYTREEFQSKSAYDIFSPLDYSKIPDYNNFSFNKNFIYEIRHRTKYGYDVLVETTSQMFYWNNNPVLLSISNDIRKRKHKELINEISINTASFALKSKTINELFIDVKNQFSRIINTDNFSISLIDNNSNNLQTVFGTFENRSNNLLDIELNKLLIFEKKPISFSTNQIIEFEKANELQQFVPKMYYWMGVPLIVEKNIIGTVSLYSQESDNDFKTEIFELLEFVSNIIAAAIHEIQFKESIKHLNTVLENKLLEQISKNEDLADELKSEIDERAKTQSELFKTKDELVQLLAGEIELNEMKSRFISMISHEYRTPLTVILSSVYLLQISKESKDDASFDKYVKRIESSVNMMTTLLDDALFFGKIESHSIQIEKRQFNILKLIELILEEIKQISHHSGVFVLKNNLNKTDLINDERMVYQIFQNLISNAEKYSNENSEVNIELNNKGQDFIISVADNGIGIPNKDITNIFDPFFRASNVGNKQGTGLGLSIVKKCVEHVKGDIALESILNKGTKFTIKIPDLDNDNII